MPTAAAIQPIFCNRLRTPSNRGPDLTKPTVTLTPFNPSFASRFVALAVAMTFLSKYRV
ncbi:hypothetical protein DF3PB_1820014 [uncultured Defluviicoccus sp.]|uniref:Uncharacterized protein n=1 Tax=metagenome TaxID=256318 RepID=A0A380TBE6_9ZZZZ|nr:hypothetical protein DF3PB_1820014 [uncultured Defluviicoccus sp.]